MALIIEQHTVRVPVPEGYLTLVILDDRGKFVHRCVNRAYLEDHDNPYPLITDEMLEVLDNHSK